MTDTTRPDRPPRVSHVGLHDIRAEHVRAGGDAGHTWAELGPVALYAEPDELMAIGNELVRQAAALDVGHRVDEAVAGEDLEAKCAACADGRPCPDHGSDG